MLCQNIKWPVPSNQTHTLCLDLRFSRDYINQHFMSVPATSRFYHEYVDEYRCLTIVPLVPTHQANVCIRAADAVIKYNMHHALISHPNVICVQETNASERETVTFPIQTEGRLVTQVMADAAYDVSKCYESMLNKFDHAVSLYRTQHVLNQPGNAFTI